MAIVISNAKSRGEALSRRAFLLSSGLFCLFSGSRTARADDLDDIRRLGEQARLSPFRLTRSAHFQGIGDAASEYQTEALSAAEAIATEFLAHMKERGFDKLALPTSRMNVVVLASPNSYAAFTGEKVEEVVGGHYDVDKNRLVVFDFRRGRERVTALAEQINSRTLAHETVHQLCHNTGLLDPKGDVPALVNEGLGTYAEMWRPKGRGKIGQINTSWADYLRSTTSASAWIPLAKLLADDTAFENPDTQTQAYGQSWLFTHQALKSKPTLPKYRSYLDRIRPRRDAKSRLADFEAAFGDLVKHEQELRRYLKRPIGV